jgi:hypothetical protein
MPTELETDFLLLETVFDLSYITGSKKLTTEDSRLDFNVIIGLAAEFEKMAEKHPHFSLKYHGLDYLLAINKFAEERLEAAFLAAKNEPELEI